ncbi:MICOS complex subunit MIC27 [Stigmatopora nigra]
MAAKVAMVAVPAVLGIASIRVYTISEVPTEGLTREKMNVYTPATKSAQAELISHKPGLVESCLSTAREGLLPVVHVVKGACISVKRRSVNIYHAGEDVYYYLKDPPPGFLPRFGTITMAGLVGMLLARKGSRLKRIAVPVGLMTAGASVCYPAQAVAVFKVTGKKVYAAGRWSRAAVSSLLSNKPTESDAVPQPQAVPSPEAAVVDEPRHGSEPCSTQHATISDTEAGSVECVPTADNLITAVAAEEMSVTHTETSTQQVSAEINSASTESLQCGQNEVPQVSEEAVEGALAPSEDTVETSDVISPAPDSFPAESLPAEPTASSEPQTKECAQVQPSPAKIPACTEEPPTPKTSNEPAVPVVESREPVTSALVEDELKTHTPEDQPTKDSKGGSGLTLDSALLDFGQSNPEDEDLYSTR